MLLRTIVASCCCTRLATEPFSVSLPCIVNMRKIVAGCEVILKWNQPLEKRRSPAPEANVFDQISQSDQKKRRAQEKGMGKLSTVVE